MNILLCSWELGLSKHNLCKQEIRICSCLFLPIVDRHRLLSAIQQKDMLGKCLGSTALSVAAVLTFVTIARLNAVSGMSIIGWTGVSLVSERRVIGAQTLVDLTAANTRQCLRMCWLFRACSALTFTFKQQRCELFVLSSLTDPGAYRLAVDREGQSADMRTARMDSSLVRSCL